MIFYSNQREKVKKLVPQNLNKSRANTSYISKTFPASKHLPAITWLNDSGSTNYQGHIDIVNIMAAYILKWLNEGYINIVKERDSKILTNMPISIVILKDPEFVYESERSVYNFIVSTSVDGTLTNKNAERYVRDNTDYYEIVSKRVYLEAVEYATDQGYIERNEKDHMYFSEKGQKEFQDTYGFKNFTRQFIRENSRRRIDKDLWDDMLIIATALGTGVELSKDFNNLDSNYTIAHSSIHPSYRARFYVERVVAYAEGIKREYDRKIEQQNS